MLEMGESLCKPDDAETSLSTGKDTAKPKSKFAVDVRQNKWEMLYISTAESNMNVYVASLIS